jgi:hypothetical protein
LIYNLAKNIFFKELEMNFFLSIIIINSIFVSVAHGSIFSNLGNPADILKNPFEFFKNKKEIAKALVKDPTEFSKDPIKFIKNPSEIFKSPKELLSDPTKLMGLLMKLVKKCIRDRDCKKEEYCSRDGLDVIGKCKLGKDGGERCLMNRFCKSKKCKFFKCTEIDPDEKVKNDEKKNNKKNDKDEDGVY